MNDAAVETRLENLLVRMEHDMLVGFAKASRDALARSTVQSNRTLLEKARLVGEALDGFVTAACGDAEALHRSGKDTRALYDLAGTKLIQLQLRGIDHVKAKATWASPFLIRAIRSEVDRAYAAAKGRLLDHEAGFGRAAPVSSAISIHAGPGAVVQANSPGARAQTNVNIQAVQPALAEFEQAAAGLSLSPENAEALKIEIETMRAQLKKPSPFSLILKECGHTMRAIIENWLSSATQPGATTIGVALWRALGMS